MKLKKVRLIRALSRKKAIDIFKKENPLWRIIKISKRFLMRHKYYFRILSEKYKIIPRYYRNMVVYNFSKIANKEEKSYPELAEFRATYISNKKINIIKKLETTVKNLSDYFAPIHIAEKKGKYELTTSFEINKKIRKKLTKLTMGFEINKEISEGEVAPLNKCIKYVRILKIKEYEYPDKKINEIIREKLKDLLFVDNEGFVFRIKGLPRWLIQIKKSKE